MRIILTLAPVLCFSSATFGQEISTAIVHKTRLPPLRSSAPPDAEDARLKALEDQVRLLGAQVALLSEALRSVRTAKSAEPSSEAHLVLASEHPESTTLAPPTPQLPQTQTTGGTQMQTFGGATSNAKLLNPDISLIGDFIGAPGNNTLLQPPPLAPT